MNALRIRVGRKALALFATTALCIAAASQANTPQSAEDPIVILDFPAAEMTVDDEYTMERYRSNPVNLRCDFVSFDGSPIVALVSEIEQGETSIDESRVEMLLPNGEILDYVGVTFEGAKLHGKNGPFLWEGKLAQNRKFFASLIITPNRGVRVYMTSESGMYRLLPSTQGDRYFLCQRDPDFRNRG